MRQVLGYPSVFLGASPKLAPSLYHLMSHLDLDDGVWYPQGGFGVVIDAIADLARRAGAVIRTRQRVVGIDTTAAGGRAQVTGVTATGPDGHTHHFAADVVVSTADLHHTETQPAGRPAHLSGEVVAKAQSGSGRGPGDARRPGRSARARAPHAAVHPGLDGQLRGHLHSPDHDSRTRIDLCVPPQCDRSGRRTGG
ncbi:FAD-dependent oxidoreductase [Microbacterium elymi]|uniref:FAD-dependent oxidoreductase n=1 Tax=Microbacterium elymi TaxID=2909587 RepID=UPI00338E5644